MAATLDGGRIGKVSWVSYVRGLAEVPRASVCCLGVGFQANGVRGKSTTSTLGFLWASGGRTRQHRMTAPHMVLSRWERDNCKTRSGMHPAYRHYSRSASARSISPVPVPAGRLRSQVKSTTSPMSHTDCRRCPCLAGLASLVIGLRSLMLAIRQTSHWMGPNGRQHLHGEPGWVRLNLEMIHAWRHIR